MADYREPLKGIGVRELPGRLQAAMGMLEEMFPGLGVVLLVAEYGEQGACAHISSVRPEDLVPLLREHARHNEVRVAKRGGALAPVPAPPAASLVARCHPIVREEMGRILDGIPFPGPLDRLPDRVVLEITKRLLAELIAGGRLPGVPGDGGADVRE